LVKREYDAIMDRTRGKVFTWRDYMLMYEALADGKKAAAELDLDTYLEPEFGDSRALTYAWVRALAELGRVEATVTADAPTTAVFQKKGARSYVAYNPTLAPLTVTFSDGFTLDVPPKQLAQKTAERPN
ncbi:MAG TPA: glycoside hydrolase, partial [Polyangia bacterium]|nr:glycoside hydrolase [Polyangia bacterium]